MVEWLPPVHAMVYCTCNSYDHKPHLERFWNEIRQHWSAIMNPALPLMLTGKGADGDPKERTMFLQLMYSRWRGRHHPRRSEFSEPLSRNSTWLGLAGAIGFRMRAERHADGSRVKGIMAQDPIHVSKKLDCKVSELDEKLSSLKLMH